MTKATGKARHPHDSSRPTPDWVKEAIEKDDIEQLKLALTPRQVRFAEEYLFDYIASNAAVRAGYSPNYADRQGHLLLKHEGVRHLINHLSQTKESKIVSVTPEYLVQKLVEILNKEGVKDSDAIRSIELMMKHKGMFVDKTEITGKDGGAIEVENRRIEEEAAGFTHLMKQLRDRHKKEVELV